MMEKLQRERKGRKKPIPASISSRPDGPGISLPL